jgi:hypothetical protein
LACLCSATLQRGGRRLRVGNPPHQLTDCGCGDGDRILRSWGYGSGRTAPPSERASYWLFATRRLRRAFVCRTGRAARMHRTAGCWALSATARRGQPPTGWLAAPLRGTSFYCLSPRRPNLSCPCCITGVLEVRPPDISSPGSPSLQVEWLGPISGPSAHAASGVPPGWPIPSAAFGGTASFEAVRSVGRSSRARRMACSQGGAATGSVDARTPDL